MQQIKEDEFSKQFDFELWKKMGKFLIPFKKLALMLAFIMALVGILDAVFPYLTKYVIDNFITANQVSGLGWFAAIYAGLVTWQALNILLMIIIAGKLETGLSYDLRRIGFNHLQELSLSYYDKKAVGWLMARMTSDIRRLGDIISWGIVDIVWGFTMMAASIVFMLAINWKLALVTMAVLPPLIAVSFYFQKIMLKIQRLVRKINSRITGSFNEGIMGARATKTLVREEKNLQEFQKLTAEMESSSVKSAIYSALYHPLAITLGSLGLGLVLWYGGAGVVENTFQYGTLVAFFSYAVMFFGPVNNLAYIFTRMQAAQASAERVISMINTEPEIKDAPEVKAKYGDFFTTENPRGPELHGAVGFKNVSFSYLKGEPVLKNFSLDVKKGEKIALVGETGSGKSTVVKLASRFYEPTSGKILIDGTDYRERSLFWLHSNLGYVLQDPHLFSGTIRDNIKYGNLEAGDEEIQKAAQTVNAHHFISRLEKGYDTEVGEKGDLLSTGEKQLVSFARAIIADPQIFILDEATSSIDTEMEKLIQSAIDKMMEGRTSFIIAHRLSTIRSADRIIVLKDGEIVEQGTHQELLNHKGYYYNLYLGDAEEGIV